MDWNTIKKHGKYFGLSGLDLKVLMNDLRRDELIEDLHRRVNWADDMHGKKKGDYCNEGLFHCPSLTDDEFNFRDNFITRWYHKLFRGGYAPPIIRMKYDACLGRLKKEWTPKLLSRGIEIPTDRDVFAGLVFSQPDYKDRQQRDKELMEDK